MLNQPQCTKCLNIVYKPGAFFCPHHKQVGRTATLQKYNRIHPDRGYTVDNMRWVTFLENCRSSK